MVSQWKDTLWEFDFYGSHGCLIQPRNILVVNDLLSDGNGFFTGVVQCPEGCSTSRAISDFLLPDEETDLDTMKFLWDAKVQQPKAGEKYILYRVLDSFPSTECDFVVDQHCIPLPVSTDFRQKLKILECFAGGYGGWSTACHFLQKFHNQDFQICGIENDLMSAWNFAKSHSAILVDGHSDIPGDILMKSNRNFILHSDIGSDKWLQCVSNWRPDIFCISSPCQPWTGAGRTKGLLSPDGAILLDAIARCKLLRPRLLLVEQVSGFVGHEHKVFIDKTFGWAGYQQIWAKLLDLQKIGPVQRVRWIAIYRRIADSRINIREMQLWPAVETFHPRSYGAVLPDALANDPRLNPTDAVLNMASLPDLLPVPRRRNMNSSEILMSRCYNDTQLLPTFMASYASQHQFEDSYLKDKGLLVHFLLTSDGTIRYWHPIEVLLLHGTVGRHHIPDTWKDAYHILGNQISTGHAMIALVNGINCLSGSDTPLDLHQVVQNFLNHKMTVSNCHLRRIPSGLLVADAPIHLTECQLDNIRNFQSRIESMRLPKGAMWTVDGFASDLSQIRDPTDPVLDVFPSPISPPSEIEHADEEISQTMNFQPILLGQILTNDGPRLFGFMAKIPFEAIEAVWDNVFEVKSHDLLDNGCSITLLPRNGPFEYHPLISKNVMMLFHDRTPTIISNDEDGMNYAKSMANLQICDAFAEVSSLSGDSVTTLFPDFDVGQQWDRDPNSLYAFAAIPKCQQQCKMDFVAQTITISIKGPITEINALGLFWTTVLSESLLHRLNMVVEQGHTSESVEVKFRICPDSKWMPTSLRSLSILISILAFRKLFDGCQESSGPHLMIKWLGRPLWFGNIAKNITCEMVLRFLEFATIPTTNGSTYSFVHHGKKLSPWVELATCPKSDHREAIVLHAVLSLQGGGLGTGSKGAFRTQVKNAIASTLLQEGYELDWVSKSVDKLLDIRGVKNLASVSAAPPGTKKLQGIHDVLTECSIEIPKLKHPSASGTAFQAKQKKRIVMPTAGNYSVLDGFLFNQDGTDAKQIPDFGSKFSGYHLIDQENAVPWLRESQRLSSDELALIVVGDLPCETSLKHEPLTLPCRDEHQRQVLMACTMVQFGDKDVIVKPTDTHKIPVDNATLVALTVWKEDWQHEWQNITQNPIAWFRQKFIPEDGMSSIWGKSFRNGRNPASPSTCLSVQVHCLVRDDSLTTFLSKTGINRIWATPKSPDGKWCSKWRLIWLDSQYDIAAAKILCAKMMHATGIAKSKDRFAIRVPADRFEATWKEIFPNTDPPKHVETSRTFKLESLPFGTTSQMLTTWAAHVKWDMRPLRPMGPRAWIIGTSEDPPSVAMCFNAMPILVRELTSKQQGSKTPILAGPKPSSSISNPAVGTSLLSDPWSNYVGTRVPKTLPAPRTVEGPTESKFQEQGAKIHELEALVNTIQTEQKSQKQSLQKMQDDMATRDIGIRKHLDSQLQTMRAELHTGFSQALQQQSKQLGTEMNEIKQLLLERAKRKSPAAEDGMDL